ncbi:MAG: glycoside hydrolase family 13 protein [Propioniciclava sp.]
MSSESITPDDVALPAPWWANDVVYQIYPRSFCDSNGDGIGDLGGIISKLDYLSDLGVDVVWLSPIYRSPQDDNGYDIADYYDIDAIFGTLDDFDALISGLHARGIKLVMDLVVNHTSDEHAWFDESRDPASPKRDWYIWRPARPGHEPGTPGAEPTNLASAFRGSVWEFDPASGEYYLHMFSRKQPDLNWENPEVRAAVHTMMNWWAERGVDGFRMDVINLISKTYPLTDGVPKPGSPYTEDWSSVINGPRVAEFLEEMSAAVGIDARPLFTVGETPWTGLEQARQYCNRTHPRLGMVFTFEHVDLDAVPGENKFAVVDVALPELKKSFARWQQGMARDGWNSLYWENHDQPRVVSRFGDDSPERRVACAKAFGTVLHLHRGTPFIYQGEEIGMVNAGFTSIDQYADIESVNHYREALAAGVPAEEILASLALKSRDNARTPMPWGAGPSAGFSTGEPWLGLNHDVATVHVQASLADPQGVHAHYRRLIALRHELEVVRDGTFDLLLPEDPRLWVFTRTLRNEQLVVVANMSSRAAGVPMAELPDLSGARLLLGGVGTDVQTLEGWEARVYLTNR